MSKKPKHFDIVIATPGRDMISPYVKSLLKTIEYFKENNISFCHVNEYSSFVPQAREWTFKSFYEIHGKDATYNKMIWIDSDISWNVEDLMALYHSDKDIVTGAYQYWPNLIAAHKTPYHAYSIKELNDINGYDRILYCGMGFLCIKPGILENLKDPFSDASYEYDGTTHQSGNEDVSFCIRAAMMLGKELWIDTRVRLDHHKARPYSWDENQERPEWIS